MTITLIYRGETKVQRAEGPVWDHTGSSALLATLLAPLPGGGKYLGIPSSEYEGGFPQCFWGKKECSMW